ncbi:MAG: heme-binding protein, partial [Lamprobacter sp.]|uniref:heme-binding protein n=1 Tax=Lamprobacter sp. TaxID=3100796 RepID=UPI002B25FBBA
MNRHNRLLTRIALAMLLTLWGGHAMATEEPPYEVVREDSGFELRRYQPQLLAETAVQGRFDKVGGKAFGILADYIFG